MEENGMKEEGGIAVNYRLGLGKESVTAQFQASLGS